MSNSIPDITPLELASLAARFSDLPPEQAIEKARTFYNASCAALEPKKTNDNSSNERKDLLKFLASIVPEQTDDHLRKTLIEFRLHSLQDSRRENGDVFTREFIENQVLKWEKDGGWEGVRNRLKDGFPKFHTQQQADKKRLEEEKLALMQQQQKQKLQDNGRNSARKKKERNWLNVARTGGDVENKRHQEFLITLRLHGRDSREALENSKSKIILDQDIIDKCVDALKEYDAKNNQKKSLADF
ncbi:MAG: hypothetical protein B9S32_04660 [Verrucomicrobia bacterium Tous-C9LFEB]|nr:MAG: hypothetical protein B9S32_04660 [Verrucomicrobia bacterium Tous-C9LFEB]